MPSVTEPVGRQRVAAAGLLVAGQQRLLVGVEEQDPVQDTGGAEVVEHRGEPLEVGSPRTSETTAARWTFDPVCMNSSTSERIISEGRLSTQK